MSSEFDFYDISAFEELDCAFAYTKENLHYHNAQISERTIVGKYNVLIDKLHDKPTEKTKIMLDDVEPPYMIQLPNDKETKVNYDLKNGYDPDVVWMGKSEWTKIDGILQYMIESGNKQFNSDFVMNRRILVLLLQTLYYPKPYEGSTFTFQWLLGAQKFGSTIYMSYYPYYPEGSNNVDSYSGHRFASYITSHVPNQMKRLESAVITSLTEFKVVQTLTLGKENAGNGLRLVFSSDIDGLGFGKTDIEFENFEIKTAKKTVNPRYHETKDNFIHPKKWLTYWAQCYLSGIPKLVVGLKTPGTQMVERIEQRKVEDIPMYRECQRIWNKQKALDFAYDFLRTVQTTMEDEEDPNNVYLFSYNNGDYEFRRISKENPKYGQYQILPQWFLNDMKTNA